MYIYVIYWYVIYLLICISSAYRVCVCACVFHLSSGDEELPSVLQGRQRVRRALAVCRRHELAGA